MIALMLAALFQSAAPAATAVAPATTPPAKAAKPVCRKETVVGSTIKKKVCPRKIEDMAQGDAAEAAEVAQAK